MLIVFRMTYRVEARYATPNSKFNPITLQTAFFAEHPDWPADPLTLTKIWTNKNLWTKISTKLLTPPIECRNYWFYNYWKSWKNQHDEALKTAVGESPLTKIGSVIDFTTSSIKKCIAPPTPPPPPPRLPTPSTPLVSRTLSTHPVSRSRPVSPATSQSSAPSWTRSQLQQRTSPINRSKTSSRNAGERVRAPLWRYDTGRRRWVRKRSWAIRDRLLRKGLI